MDLSAAKRAFYLGRYNCVERLASGPLGETFRAKIYGVAGFEKQFSVKKLHAMLCQDEEFVARFVKAAAAYAGLQHERIAHVHEVNVQGMQYYLASDLVRGAELERIIELLGQRNEALQADVALLIASDVAEALSHAHGFGLIHSGLAPHAILLGFEGDVRVADLGLLGALVRPGWAEDDDLLPALAYVAPEVIGAKSYDVRADVFSLGAVLYEMLSGRRPYPGHTARDVRLQMEQGPPAPPPGDQRLQTLLTRALHPHAERRPESMDEVRRILGELLGGRAARARTELGGVVRRLVRPERKTGSFPLVATPPPIPAAARGESSEKPWAPPVKPPPTPPSAPIGPQLSTIPPRNTFAGMGPDDQVLVPIELMELPGTPTARELPVVQPAADDVPTTPLERIELEPDTEPIEKLAPSNGTAPHLALETPAPAAPMPSPAELRAEPPIPPLVPQSAPTLPPPIPGANPAPPMAPLVTPMVAPQATPMIAQVPVEAPPMKAPPAAPPPLGLPPPPTNRWKLVVGISLGVTVLASGGLYLAAQHEADPPHTTLGESSVSPPAETPKPAVEAPRPVVEATKPVVVTAKAPPEAEKPAVEAAKPAVEAAKPAVEAPKPAVEAPKPVVEAPKPAVEAPKPAVEAPKPMRQTPIEAPAATGNGAIDLRSTPPGAQVWIDGTQRGQTPMHLELPVGSHTLLLLTEGARMHRESLKVAAGATQLDVQLPPATLPQELKGDAGLKVRCKTLGELRILVDGADTGRACPNEQRISVAPGPHKIGLYSPRADKTYEVEKELPDDDRVSTRVYVRY